MDKITLAAAVVGAVAMAGPLGLASAAETGRRGASAASGRCGCRSRSDRRQADRSRCRNACRSRGGPSGCAREAGYSRGPGEARCRAGASHSADAETHFPSRAHAGAPDLHAPSAGVGLIFTPSRVAAASQARFQAGRGVQR